MPDACRWNGSWTDQPRPAAHLRHRGKGRIAVGWDADFSVVDLRRRETITNARQGSRAGWTPHDGREVVGWPIGTIVRGARVMWEGEIVAPARGQAVRFQESL